MNVGRELLVGAGEEEGVEVVGGSDGGSGEGAEGGSVGEGGSVEGGEEENIEEIEQFEAEVSKDGN